MFENWKGRIFGELWIAGKEKQASRRSKGVESGATKAGKKLGSAVGVDLSEEGGSGREARVRTRS